MPLVTAPWAVDGARIPAALARVASYAESGGVEGVISRADLKVSPLAVPGNGVTIAEGGALLLNRYQTTPSQSYSVLNVGAETLDAADMPPASGSTATHLICVTVGDPEFSQVGHPWMLATDPPAGEEETFQYVRFFVVRNVPAGTKSFRELGFHYPAYALARVTIPANTTTITAAMITDLRKLARPRSVEEIFNASVSSSNNLNGGAAGAGAFENWPNTANFAVDVPEWATVAKVFGYVANVVHSHAGAGSVRISFDSGGSTPETYINEDDPTGGISRKGYNIGGAVSVDAAKRGTTQTIRIQGSVANDNSKTFLATDSRTSSMIRVRFEESVI